MSIMTNEVLDCVEQYTREDSLRLIELLIASGAMVMDGTAEFLMKILIAEIRRSRAKISLQEEKSELN